LRPSFKFLKSLAEAIEAVAEMEKEIKESLKKTAPDLLESSIEGEKMLQAAQATVGIDGLEPIKEDEEELNEDGAPTRYLLANINANDADGEADDDERNDYQVEEENENDSDSYNVDNEKEEDEEDQGEVLDDGDEKHQDENHQRVRSDSRSFDHFTDSNGSELDDLTPVVHTQKKQVMSPEDEEFVKAFESMITENIAVCYRCLLSYRFYIQHIEYFIFLNFN
jgi:hypothetical protein